MATRFSDLAWRVHGQRSLAGHGVGSPSQTHLSDELCHFHFHFYSECSRSQESEMSLME